MPGGTTPRRCSSSTATSSGRRRDLASCLAVMRRGRPGTPVAKLVLAGPPPAGAPDPWSDDKFRAWCLACRGWKVAGLGEGPTVAAVTVDRDKRALCFWCVCRVEDGKGGWKLSVDAVIERLAGRFGRPSDSEPVA